MTQIDFVREKLGLDVGLSTMEVGSILSKAFVIGTPRDKQECQRLFAIFINSIYKTHSNKDFNLIKDPNKKFNHLIPKSSENQMFSIGSDIDREHTKLLRNPKAKNKAKPINFIKEPSQDRIIIPLLAPKKKIDQSKIATKSGRSNISGPCIIVKENPETILVAKLSTEVKIKNKVVKNPMDEFRSKYKTTQEFYDSIVWKKLRRKVLLTYGSKCMCCGATPNNATICVDHIKPISKHPELAEEFNNLQVLCEPCNCGKMADDETDHRPT